LRFDSPEAEVVADNKAIAPMLDQVAKVISGDQRADELPLDLHGTPFQMRVWEALRAIPRGDRCTYGELARRLGLPVAAARAVGAACGANPVSVLVPCHRVVGASGDLRGYRGGLPFKRALLDIESGDKLFN
jgi:methylated-DNA-[protein]-cysteine S-methyltransferase